MKQHDEDEGQADLEKSDPVLQSFCVEQADQRTVENGHERAGHDPGQQRDWEKDQRKKPGGAVEPQADQCGKETERDRDTAGIKKQIAQLGGEVSPRMNGSKGEQIFFVGVDQGLREFEYDGRGGHEHGVGQREQRVHEDRGVLDNGTGQRKPHKGIKEKAEEKWRQTPFFASPPAPQVEREKEFEKNFELTPVDAESFCLLHDHDLEKERENAAASSEASVSWVNWLNTPSSEDCRVISLS